MRTGMRIRVAVTMAIALALLCPLPSNPASAPSCAGTGWNLHGAGKGTEGVGSGVVGGGGPVVPTRIAPCLRETTREREGEEGEKGGARARGVRMVLRAGGSEDERAIVRAKEGRETESEASERSLGEREQQGTRTRRAAASFAGERTMGLGRAGEGGGGWVMGLRGGGGGGRPPERRG